MTPAHALIARILRGCIDNHKICKLIMSSTNNVNEAAELIIQARIFIKMGYTPSELCVLHIGRRQPEVVPVSISPPEES